RVSNLTISADLRERICEQCNALLNHLKQSRDAFFSLSVTIGVSRIFHSLDESHSAYKEAQWAVCQRIVDGSDHILDGSCQHREQEVFLAILQESIPALESAVESLSEENIIQTIEKLYTTIRQSGLSGYEILQLINAIMNAYLLSMQKNKYHIPNEDSIFASFSENVRNCSSLPEIIDLLRESITSSFEEYCREKRNTELRPIQTAKQYVRKHIGEAVTLKDICTEINFNEAYFSALFKKETGMNFSKYLIQTRMEAAKELPRNSDFTIEAVAKDVGYTDIKSFTKNFSKYTGLKPSEYRRLYG
ncbi:MAG: AraC family transcriptional regulator, partial [Lachnospiraceae bacterium]|nr:AraC family transcriptional regulator [Lachnospiraceae bacterium]